MTPQLERNQIVFSRAAGVATTAEAELGNRLSTEELLGTDVVSAAVADVLGRKPEGLDLSSLSEVLLRMVSEKAGKVAADRWVELRKAGQLNDVHCRWAGINVFVNDWGREALSRAITDGLQESLYSCVSKYSFTQNDIESQGDGAWKLSLPFGTWTSFKSSHCPSDFPQSISANLQSEAREDNPGDTSGRIESLRRVLYPGMVIAMEGTNPEGPGALWQNPVFFDWEGNPISKGVSTEVFFEFLQSFRPSGFIDKSQWEEDTIAADCMVVCGDEEMSVCGWLAKPSLLAFRSGTEDYNRFVTLRRALGFGIKNLELL